MSNLHFEKRSRLGAPAEIVFAWHERPDAFARLTPPWEPVHLVEQTGGIRDGARVVLEIRPFPPIRIRWVARHTDYVAGRQFVDVQESGPFAYWRHTHRVEADGPDACWLIDRIAYRLPLAPLSHWLAGWFTRRKLSRMFEYRHRVMREAFNGSTAASARAETKAAV